jgi:hypothetical protein
MPDRDRRFVYEALCARVGAASDSSRAASRGAMAACAAALGVSLPSAAAYDRWQVTAPAGLGAPTSARIRREFAGSWSGALGALLDAPQADPTRRRLLTNCPRYTDEQVLDGVRRFVESLSPEIPATSTVYVEWASEEPLDIDGRSRVPRTRSPAVRVFGSWDAAVKAAASEPRRARSRRHRPPGRFTKDDAMRSLRAAHRELGDPLTMTRYDAWVRLKDRLRSERSEGAGEPAPLVHTVANMFGGWPEALVQALGEDVTRARRSRRRGYPDAQLAASWRACEKHVGHASSQHEYDAWRYSQPPLSDGSIPHAFGHTLSRRICNGSWSGVARALRSELPRSRRSRREFSDDELLAPLRACATELGRIPSEYFYNLWRQDQLARDDTQHLPVSHTLCLRIGHGSWRTVVAALDFVVPRIASRRDRFTRQDLIDAWQQCVSDLHEPPSIADYKRWRQGRVAQDPARRVPHYKTVADRLGGGSWRKASREATGAHADAGE